MRAGREHYRSAVGAGELAGIGAGTRNQSGAELHLVIWPAASGVPQRLRKKSIFKWATAKGVCDIPKTRNVLEYDCVWRGVLQSRLDCP